MVIYWATRGTSPRLTLAVCGRAVRQITKSPRFRTDALRSQGQQVLLAGIGSLRQLVEPRL